MAAGAAGAAGAVRSPIAVLGMFRRYRLCLEAKGMWQAQFICQGHWPQNPEFTAAVFSMRTGHDQTNTDFHRICKLWITKSYQFYGNDHK